MFGRIRIEMPIFIPDEWEAKLKDGKIVYIERYDPTDPNIKGAVERTMMMFPDLPDTIKVLKEPGIVTIEVDGREKGTIALITELLGQLEVMRVLRPGSSLDIIGVINNSKSYLSSTGYIPVGGSNELGKGIPSEPKTQ